MKLKNSGKILALTVVLASVLTNVYALVDDFPSSGNTFDVIGTFYIVVMELIPMAIISLIALGMKNSIRNRNEKNFTGDANFALKIRKVVSDLAKEVKIINFAMVAVASLAIIEGIFYAVPMYFILSFVEYLVFKKFINKSKMINEEERSILKQLYLGYTPAYLNVVSATLLISILIDKLV